MRLLFVMGVTLLLAVVPSLSFGDKGGKTKKSPVKHSAPAVEVTGYKDFLLGSSWKDLQGRFEFQRGDAEGQWYLVGEERLLLEGADLMLPMHLYVVIQGDTVATVALVFQTKQNTPDEIQHASEEVLAILKDKYPVTWRHEHEPPDSLIGFESTTDSAEDSSGNRVSMLFTTARHMSTGPTSSIYVFYELPKASTSAEDAL